MSEPITLAFDTTRFQREFKQRCERSMHYSAPELANVIGRSIAMKAHRYTTKAANSDIMEIGLMQNFIGKRKNKFGRPILLKRPTYILTGGRVGAIYAAHLRAKGLKPKAMTPEEFAKGARRMLTARLQAIGFLKSGWLPAIRKLMGVTKQAASVDESTDLQAGKQRGKPKGACTPATAETLTCTIENSATGGLSAQQSASKQRIWGHLKEGLRRAFQNEMENLAERNHQFFRELLSK